MISVSLQDTEQDETIAYAVTNTMYGRCM